MATELKPQMEARIADLAKQLGFTGADATEQVLKMALDSLEATPSLQPDDLTAEQIRQEYLMLSAAGRRWREEHPDQYDENNPPSKTWQEELYDERGLPK